MWATGVGKTGAGGGRENVWRGQVVCVSSGDGVAPSLAALIIPDSRHSCETLIPVDLFFSPAPLCSSTCRVERHLNINCSGFLLKSSFTELSVCISATLKNDRLIG